MTRADLMADYLLWDNREDVRYESDGQLDTASLDLTDCKRRALNYSELVSTGGALATTDLAWLVPVAVLPDEVTPKIGDRIYDDDGAEWTVLGAALNTWRTWWRLATRNVVIHYSLMDRVTLLSPSLTKDAAGGRVPVYTAVETDLPAALFETDAAAEARLGKRQGVRRFTATVGRTVNPAADWRLVDAAGTVYQITGWRTIDFFNIVQELDLEVVK